MKSTFAALLSLLAAFTWFPSVVVAQQAQLLKQDPPYYAGFPALVQVLVENKGEDEEPRCNLVGDAPEGVTISTPNVSVSSQSSTVLSFGGKRTVYNTSEYRFSFRVFADRPGSFSIGPFEVTMGSEVIRVPATTMEFKEPEVSEKMSLTVELPAEKLYVGQSLPMKFRLVFDGTIEELEVALSNLTIRSPLFEYFTFPETSRDSNVVLRLDTPSGERFVDAQASRETIDGKSLIVIEGTLSSIADRTFKSTEMSASCSVREVIEWQRDFFRQLKPGRVVGKIAKSEPLRIEVLPLPSAGRPASFTGAVGKGYSIEVKANRSVVRVGDPITLDIELTGDGDIGAATLPDLSNNQQLPERQFQVPRVTPPAETTEFGKRYKVQVRVSDESVSQIPPLSFSWFDPEKGSYRTTQSKPIALQVLDGQMVSAADVVSNQVQTQVSSSDPSSTPATNGPSAVAGESSSNRSSASGNNGNLNFIGANLAIERDPATLINGTSWLQSPKLPAISYAAATILAIGFSLVIALRQQRSKSIVARSEVVSTKRQLERIRTQPSREAAMELANLLRKKLAGGRYEEHRSSLEKLTGECDALAYAPQTTSEPNRRVLDLVERASELLLRSAA